jgi:hypothetical protein
MDPNSKRPAKDKTVEKILRVLGQHKKEKRQNLGGDSVREII